MGDRTTPMKFGPEWLRNLSREPTGAPAPVVTGAPAPVVTGAPAPAPGSGAPPATQAIRPVTTSATANPNTSASAKVQLANFRYGREEMLALYDPQSAEAPVQLKTIEVLYHSRGKSPYALNSNFEEDTRDGGGTRSNPPSGAMSTDRFGPGRGRGYNLSSLTRGNTVIEGRGRARLFPRPTSSGRAPSWHNGAQRSYTGPPDDDPNSPRGLMWNNGNGNPPGIRPTGEQADWANKMAYRKPRPNQTNWRQQQNRDEGEEWRTDGARRSQDKWDREWPERSPQEKGWSTNRRHWGGDADELPEWAVENSEACGGTFDASGAFHGYSNDDSNIPKAQDSSYALARSQTHGSLAQDFKQFAKRRFDAIEVKFKTPTDESVTEESGTPPSASNDGANANSGQTREIPKIEKIGNKQPSHEEPEKETPEMQDEAAALPADHEERSLLYMKAMKATAQRKKMLREAEDRESSSEQGTYKSVVMATSNNQLRQQPQNVGTSPNKQNYTPRFQLMLDCRKKMERIYQEQKKKENKLVDDMLDMHISEEFQAQLLNATTQSAGIPNSINSFSNQMPSSGMQMRTNTQLMTPGIGINQQQSSNSQSQPTPETNMMRPIGISNSVLNASLGLPVGTGTNMNMPLKNMPPPPIPNPGVLSSNLQGLGTGNMQNLQVGGIQSRMQVPGMPATSFQNAMPSNNMQVPGMPATSFQNAMPSNNMQVPGMPATSFQNAMPSNNMQGLQPNMQTSNMNNNNMQAASGMPGYQAHSLFMGAPNNMQNPGEMGNQGQQNMYPMHGLQQSASQGSFTPASLYGNMMQPPPAVPHPNIPLADLWYYEDPNKTIQGPFTSKEMYGWYHAGFFTPELMVRRACESGLMPLASYGLMPFGPADIVPQQYSLSRARFDMQQHENMMNAQQAGLGPEVESLWGMREPADEMWYRPTVPMPPPEQVKTILNNLSMFFWEQPTDTTKSVPETIKDMKTEDEILAQMRASQMEPAAQNLTFICDAAVSPEEAFTAGTNIAPNLEELQKLIGSDIHRTHTPPVQEPPAATVAIVPPRTQDAVDQKPSEKADPELEVSVKEQLTAKAADAKTSKQPAKIEEKPKIKETLPKTKAKKVKEEKKEELVESKKEEKKIIEKRSEEPSPPKNKREDKANKKDLEKEKKEWLKDGFTLVKGAEKKDSKKKEKEEARASEEAEKKRKEEEKRALEAEKNKAPEPVTRRQQLEQGQRQSQSLEQPPKKAPWSAQSAQTSRDGLALSDIQRLEREKKLEQIKEQQQMMQVIAQQQAVAAQREQQQENQAGQLGWAKKKQVNSPPRQTLAEIQAEARKQAAAMVAAAAAAAAREEKQPTPPPVNVMPWGATNGAGFWDCPSSSTASGKECAVGHFSFLGSPTSSEFKSKKKVTVVAPSKKQPSPPKKEVSPSADFDTWCIHVLSNWKDAASIDIPTFVAFLRDIESPYEVKDYVKCYLGDTKEANDFARQFLERRSRMLRVGMVTPSDDLCSPAAALTPRTNSGSDYTEVKSKGNKKTKKNKMLKIDARILGFSVTASEDRINVGDIDTA